MPDVRLEDLKFAPEFEDGNACEHCGQVHDHDSEFDENFDENECGFDETAEYDEFNAYDFEAEASRSIEFFQRLVSVPVQQMITPELAATLVQLRDSGYSREEAAFMVLETMVRETERMTENRESEPNLPRFISALADLAEAQ